MIFNIVIDANIGAGKTTLLHNLKKKLINSDKVVYNFFEENVNSWMAEGWLKKYYSNIPRYAASFQTRVLLSHIQQRQEIANINDKQNNDVIFNICERSAITTVNIFSKMLLNDNLIDEMEMNLHKQILEVYEYNKPDILIYLDTNPEVSYERLKKRARNGEIDISLDYLEKLNETYLEEKEKLAKNVYVINGNQSEEIITQKCCDILSINDIPNFTLLN